MSDYVQQHQSTQSQSQPGSYVYSQPQQPDQQLSDTGHLMHIGDVGSISNVMPVYHYREAAIPDSSAVAIAAQPHSASGHRTHSIHHPEHSDLSSFWSSQGYPYSAAPHITTSQRANIDIECPQTEMVLPSHFRPSGSVSSHHPPSAVDISTTTRSDLPTQYLDGTPESSTPQLSPLQQYHSTMQHQTSNASADLARQAGHRLDRPATAPSGLLSASASSLPFEQVWAHLSESDLASSLPSSLRTLGSWTGGERQLLATASVRRRASGAPSIKRDRCVTSAGALEHQVQAMSGSGSRHGRRTSSTDLSSPSTVGEGTSSQARTEGDNMIPFQGKLWTPAQLQKLSWEHAQAEELLKHLRGRSSDSKEGVAACDYCRRRKIRCDRAKPTCGKCSAIGRECTTDDSLRKRGPPSKRERDLLAARGLRFIPSRVRRRASIDDDYIEELQRLSTADSAKRESTGDPGFGAPHPLAHRDIAALLEGDSEPSSSPSYKADSSSSTRSTSTPGYLPSELYEMPSQAQDFVTSPMPPPTTSFPDSFGHSMAWTHTGNDSTSQHSSTLREAMSTARRYHSDAFDANNTRWPHLDGHLTTLPEWTPSVSSAKATQSSGLDGVAEPPHFMQGQSALVSSGMAVAAGHHPAEPGHSTSYLPADGVSQPSNFSAKFAPTSGPSDGPATTTTTTTTTTSLSPYSSLADALKWS